MESLLGWADAAMAAAPDDLTAALSDAGIVHRVAERFATEIGVWA